MCRSKLREQMAARLPSLRLASATEHVIFVICKEKKIKNPHWMMRYFQISPPTNTHVCNSLRQLFDPRLFHFLLYLCLFTCHVFGGFSIHSACRSAFCFDCLPPSRQFNHAWQLKQNKFSGEPSDAGLKVGLVRLYFEPIWGRRYPYF